MHGHDVVIFERRPKAGGLNEYGIASYKATGGFVQKEVDWLLQIGGIEIRTGMELGRDLSLHQLTSDFDAVFFDGGMTAVDAAVQSKLLGAENVTIVYRRGPEKMSASGYEQDHAAQAGVRIIRNAADRRGLTLFRRAVVADEGGDLRHPVIKLAGVLVEVLRQPVDGGGPSGIGCGIDRLDQGAAQAGATRLGAT